MRTLGAVAALLLAAGTVSAATPAQIEASRAQALAWLVTHQQDDGRWQGANALDVPSTAQTIESLRAAGVTGFSYARGLAWLANEEPTSVESIARKVLALRAAGLDNRAPATLLLGSRNRWTGWGAYEQFNTSFPDTPLAASALRQGDLGATESGTARLAVSCDILPNQAAGNDSNTGGWSYTGWSFIGGLTAAPANAGKGSEISPTVHSMLEVAAYRDMGYTSLSCITGGNTYAFSLSGSLDAGANWLLNRRRNSDGSFGIPGQPRSLDTALAYLGIARARPQDSSLPAAHDYLLSQQTPDGSWQGDAFVTATVLQALGGSVLTDTDVDGIPDAVETVLGSNPAVADSRAYAGRNGQSEAGVTAPQAYLATLNQSFSTPVVSSPGPFTGGTVIGELPQGLSFNTTTGTISGTPTSTGYYNFTFQYVDANGVAHSALIQISVGAPDVTAPAVTGRTPLPGSTGVDTGIRITASFSEPVNPATLTSSTFQLRDGANQLVAATVVYDAASLTATLVPSNALGGATTYTVNVKGGGTSPRVQDTSGNALAADVSWVFTTPSGPQCPCTVWDESTIPPQSTDEASSIELGVRFRTSVNGYITGVRFYKASGNTGTHAGTLWSATGEMLASATFTNETPSGWQQVNFSTPVAVTANTVYVASYHAPNGHYMYEHDFFLQAGVQNGPLYLLRDGESGGPNGVYLYGSNVVFPTSSYVSSNYSVDVVFDTTPLADTTAPTITTKAPAPAATGVAVASVVTATFSEALDPATVGSSTFELRDASNQLVPANVSYDSSAFVVTLTPSAALAHQSTYSVTVRGGSGTPAVRDLAGNALASNVTWSFTTVAGSSGGSQCPCSVWDESTVPPQSADSDFSSIELGVKFKANANGFITGVRFYKAAGNTGTHTGSLWSVTGQLLASATFTNETATGWQQVTFSSPVPVTADTVYVASYHAPNGNYMYEHDYFLAQGTSHGPLYLLRDGENGGNGVYAYGSGSTFPESTFMSSNYSVDVVFEPESECPCSIWDGSTVPTQSADSDFSSIELGVKFKANVDGFITGVRFYKAAGNTGTHTGSLWSVTGQLLASATFTNETATGWQQVTFSSPVPVTADTVYVASYHAPNGNYMYEYDYFLAQGTSQGPLYLLRDGESGGNGVYAYGSGTAFPTSTWKSSNYSVDVVFEPGSSQLLTLQGSAMRVGATMIPPGGKPTAGSASSSRFGAKEGAKSADERGDTSDVGEVRALPTQNMALRYDAAAAAKQYGDGAAVVWWQDLSSHGADARGSEGTAPTMVSRAGDGTPALRFDGVDDYLQLPPGFADFTEGLSLYVVMRASAHEPHFRVLALGNSPDRQGVVLGGSESKDGIEYATSDSAGQTSPVTADDITSDEMALYSVLQEPGAPDTVSFAELARNGTALFGKNVFVPPVLRRDSNFVGKGDGRGGFFRGDIAEVVVYDRMLTPDEQASVYRYFAEKYSLKQE